MSSLFVSFFRIYPLNAIILCYILSFFLKDNMFSLSFSTLLFLHYSLLEFQTPILLFHLYFSFLRMQSILIYMLSQ